MATTSMSLGPHFEGFIKKQIASGRYKNASEVVRDGLRTLETREEKLEALKAAIQPGIDAANRDEFVEDFDIEDVIARAIKRADSAA